MIPRHQAVASVCALLEEENLAGAADVLRREYPFTPAETVERKYGDQEALKVFLRDGFIDRYSGAPLVFPGVLRVLAMRLPAEFPYHPNWKMTATHMAFWELSPTVDHIVPIARGGVDAEPNWVTTSMLRNSAKANWTLEESGWQLLPPGDLRVWDGLLAWFRRAIASHPELLQNSRIAAWHRAALLVAG
ncbi:MAG TPA: HNH endonuclease [Thermoanaerobaculia bacterium]|nr:HNH endonuclease [Thermoanaerobaculia bacterium]